MAVPTPAIAWPCKYVARGQSHSIECADLGSCGGYLRPLSMLNYPHLDPAHLSSIARKLDKMIRIGSIPFSLL
ncbi:hypothetical protein CDL15_Pgr019675 [Punica granatum]|uniref:Uncharacterized protein n=1 Tax=Punica granatum TaxID=22663 RepID=A0A218X582_PUNGR|nr:hypothetical protein CDL15_Pgr019675 [Punica granatum]